MTINELNTKIHLPSLATHLGYKEYSYVKLPRFGWFGYNRNMSHIFNVVSVFSRHAISLPQIYRYLTIEHPEFQEYRMFYSEVLENKLFHDVLLQSEFSKFLIDCQAAAESDKIRFKKDTMRFTKLLEELGMSLLLATGIGLVTPRIVETYKNLKIKDNLTNKLVIPSFCTPQHWCAIELADVDTLEDRMFLYKNQEAGWHGVLNHVIVSQFKDLITVNGCTWDPKIDYWTSAVVDLHPSLSINQCIEIWSKCKNLQCSKSPLEFIKAEDVDSIKDHLNGLTPAQIKELEGVTGLALRERWVASKTLQTEVCGLKLISRNDKYYIVRHGEPMEYTNFTVKLTKIAKENGIFWQHGFVYYNGTETPFKIERSVFDSFHAFYRRMGAFFLEAGIGVPIIAPTFKHYLTNVITAFNPENHIEGLQPQGQAYAPAATIKKSPLNRESPLEKTPSEAHHCEIQPAACPQTSLSSGLCSSA